MITIEMDRQYRRKLLRVGFCEEAGDRILDHLEREIADLTYDLGRYNPEYVDFRFINDRRMDRRKIMDQMDKVARIQHACTSIAARLSHPSRLLSLNWYERAVLESWLRHNTERPCASPALEVDSAMQWLLLELADPHHSL